MTYRLAGLAALLILSGCGDKADSTSEEPLVVPNASEEPAEIVPGLTAQTTKRGSGRVAVPGDAAEVHYTGWLYDPNAEDNRGEKFDSSVDRGQTFVFPLGAGRVIRGWDQGVAGMLIGEKRELIIAPELAYGARGAGDVIPPNATLLFEVELIGLEGPADEETAE